MKSLPNPRPEATDSRSVPEEVRRFKYRPGAKRRGEICENECLHSSVRAMASAIAPRITRFKINPLDAYTSKLKERYSKMFQCALEIRSLALSLLVMALRANEIDELLEPLAPYLSNWKLMQSFLEEHEALDKNELINALEDVISNSTGPLRTDYKILLNKLYEEKR